MAIGDALRALFVDNRLQWILLLVALDFGLGIIAALKLGTFRLTYIADFLRTDVLFKVAPFALVYLGYKYAPSSDIVIPGLDLEIIMNGVWAIMVGAMVASVLKSLRDLGLFGSDNAPPKQPLKAIDVIAGPDPVTPL